MPAWKKAKKPLFSNSKSLKTMMETETPVVLIDLRDGESAKAAHIQGAVSIPADQLAEAKERFPSIKKAPIVLYGADTKSALENFATVRDWGYMNTTVLIGGFDGWQKADLPVASGDTATEIVYVPKPKAGSVDIASFAKALESKTTDVVILDVRTDDETEAGKSPAPLPFLPRKSSTGSMKSRRIKKFLFIAAPVSGRKWPMSR